MVQQSACATARSHMVSTSPGKLASSIGPSPAKLRDWPEPDRLNIDHRHGYSRSPDPMYHPPSPPKTPTLRKCGGVTKTVRRTPEIQSAPPQVHFSILCSGGIDKKPARPRRGVVAMGDRLPPFLDLTPPNASKALDPNQSLECLVGHLSHISKRSLNEPVQNRQKFGGRSLPKNMITVVGEKSCIGPEVHNLKSFAGSTEEGKEAMEKYIASQSRWTNSGDLGDQCSVGSWDVDLYSGGRTSQD